MTALIDFDNVPEVYRGYDGADKKVSVHWNGHTYMLKWARRLREEIKGNIHTSYPNSPVAEYIGSRIFDDIGIETQETELGMFGGKLVVACKDFIADRSDGFELYEFKKAENSFLDSDFVEKQPTLESINAIFDNHYMVSKIGTEARVRYWDTFVVDALIANPDRHQGNWGYLVSRETSEIKLAPVFDCGSALHSRLADESLPAILANKGEVNNFTMNLPYAALRIADKKVNFREYLNSTENKALNESLLRVFPRINMDNIENIVHNTPGLNDIRKEFISVILKGRYEHILLPAYEKALAHEKRVEAPDTSWAATKARVAAAADAKNNLAKGKQQKPPELAE